MQLMEKALQFTQLISFTLVVWRSMTSLPLVLVASNAFLPWWPQNSPCCQVGPCYMDMHAPTDDELAQLPHVLMTSDDPWDLHSLDYPFLLCWNGWGNWGRLEWMQWWLWGGLDEHELNATTCLRAVHAAVWSGFSGAVKPPRSILPKKPNFDALQPNFCWIFASGLLPMDMAIVILNLDA